MKKRSDPRRRGNSEKSEENLRGKLRDLGKQLESAKRYAKSLEKKIERMLGNGISEKSEESVPHKSNDPTPSVCNSCGSENEIRKTSVWTPSGEVVWLICQICKNRERKK